MAGKYLLLNQRLPVNSPDSKKGILGSKLTEIGNLEKTLLSRKDDPEHTSLAENIGKLYLERYDKKTDPKDRELALKYIEYFFAKADPTKGQGVNQDLMKRVERYYDKSEKLRYDELQEAFLYNIIELNKKTIEENKSTEEGESTEIEITMGLMYDVLLILRKHTMRAKRMKVKPIISEGEVLSLLEIDPKYFKTIISYKDLSDKKRIVEECKQKGMDITEKDVERATQIKETGEHIIKYQNQILN